MKRIMLAVAGLLVAGNVWAQTIVFECDSPVPHSDRAITVISDQYGNVLEYDIYTTNNRCQAIQHDINQLLQHVDVTYILQVIDGPDRCFSDDDTEIPCFVSCVPGDLRPECAQ